MKTEEENDKPHGSIILIVLIQTVFYSAGLCILYMFRFSEAEATGLASIDRYLSMTFLTMLLMLFVSVFDYVERHPARCGDVGMVTLIFALTALPVDHVSAFLNRNSVGTSSAVRQPYDHVSLHLLDLTQNDRKKVYVLSQRDMGLDYFALKYSVRPCITNRTAYSISPDSEQFENSSYTTVKTADEWKNELQEYDYVILYKLDEVFAEDYGALFEDPSEIRDYAIYEVDHQTGMLLRCR